MLMISRKSFINELLFYFISWLVFRLVHFHRDRKITWCITSRVVCVHIYWEIYVLWMGGVWLELQSSRGAHESPFLQVWQSQKLMRSIVRKNKSPNNWPRSHLCFLLPRIIIFAFNQSLLP